MAASKSLARTSVPEQGRTRACARDRVLARNEGPGGDGNGPAGPFGTVCPALAGCPSLAHVDNDRTEPAYRRTRLFDCRRELLLQWADYLTALRQSECAAIAS